ncbi:MAG: hypothetical protein R3C53_07290 [Pirellulaceae bacterium]
MVKLSFRMNSLMHDIGPRLRARFANAARGLLRRHAARRKLREELQDLFLGSAPHFRRLEARRVLSANYVFDGVDGLFLNNFDNTGLDISFTDGPGPNDFYVFTLDAGTWSAGVGNVVDPDVTGTGTNVLSVRRGAFLDLGDTPEFDVDDNLGIGLNATFISAVDLPNAINGSMTLTVGGNVNINGALDTLGSSLSITANGTINSTVAGSITTTDAVDFGIPSGTVTLIAGGDVNLAGDIDTSGADHSTAGATASAAGEVRIITTDGSINVAGIDASGGNATGGGGSTGGAGAGVFLTARDLNLPDDLRNITTTGLLNTFGGAGDTLGAAGDSKLISDNDVTLAGANLQTGNLFIVATGNVDQTAGIVANGLGLMVGGTTTLNDPTNNIGILAADNDGQILFTDANSLATGTVTVTDLAVPMSVNGITTSDDDVKLTVLAGDLTIAAAISLGTGDLFLDVTGDVTQGATISAAGLGLMVDGATTLNNVGNNVATLAADNGGLTQYTDADTLVVGAVTVDGMTVTGITTTDDDVKLTVLVGDLDINNTVALGAGSLFLDITGNVAQTASITATGLGLMVDGTTTLDNASNNVTTFAADNGGQTLFTDADTLVVAAVTVAGMTVTGITTTNDDVKLTVLAGNLDINNAIALGTGDLFLDVTGNVAQTAAITAAGLGLMVDGTTTLNNVANNVTTLAADNGGQTLFTDANTLVVGSVTVDGMTVTGVTTTNDDVKLTVLAGNLNINNAIALGTGDLFLDVTGNVSQTAAITAAGLGLMVDGTTTLNNVANNVTTLAADNGGQTLFTDADTLVVGSVTVDGMTVTGVTTTNDDVKLTVLVGNLDINNAIAMGTGDLFLDITGNVAQTAAIASAGLGLMVDGTTTLTNVGNSFATLAADNGGTIDVSTTADLTIGSVTVDGMTVDDVVAPADITITAASILDGDTLPDNPVDFDIDGANVTLTATTGSIGAVGDIFKGIVNPLEVRATGTLDATALLGAIALNPDAATINLNSPNVALVSAGTLTIGDLTVLGDLRVEGADIVASDGTINLTANRILFVSGQTETIEVTTSILDARTAGDLFVSSTSAIELLDLDCDNVALGTTPPGGVGAAAGLISVVSVGQVTVSDDVIAGIDGLSTSPSSASVSIVTTGADTDIRVNDVILTDDGTITLQATRDVRFGDPATLSANDNLTPPDDDDLFVVTTVNGAILIQADSDGSGDGEVFMADGARIIAGRDITVPDYVPNIDGLASTSTIQLGAVAKGPGLAFVQVVAEDDVTLGSIQSANETANAIRITSLTGGILDGGDTHTDIVDNFTGALTTLRAVTGIGSTDEIETSIYALDAVNTTSGAICIEEVSSIVPADGDLILVNADNVEDIVVQVIAGNLTVAANGFAPSNGLFNVNSSAGNILLIASADVVVNETVTASLGHLTLDAGDDVDVNAALAAGGDIYIEARNGAAADAIAPAVDGINIDATANATGSILLRSSQDIRTTADIASSTASVGLVASNNILQNANVDASGSVLIDATGLYTMAGTAVTTAGVDIAARAGSSITLGRLDAAGNVGLQAGTDIIDGNGGALNISAIDLSMRAGNLIGNSGGGVANVNINAIDTQVTRLAATATNGVYVQEVDGVSIGSVAAVDVTVTANRVNTDRSISSENANVVIAALAGGSTNPGPFKVQVTTGSLTVDSAVTATGAGDVLLQANQDVIINAAVTGGSGHVTLDAGDDVDVNAAVSTTGAGEIYILAGNNTIDMALPQVDGVNIDATLTTASGSVLVDSQASIRTTAAIASGGEVGLRANGGDIIQNANITAIGGVLLSASGALVMAPAATTSASNVVARASGGDFTLSVINATNVALEASGSIFDGNGSALNVSATTLSMQAGGSIGDSNLASPVTINNNAIDTQVDTLAASSVTGIYINEQDDLTIDSVASLSVDVGAGVGLPGVSRANFNSTTSQIAAALTIGGLSDLTTTLGPIKVIAQAGTITVNDGDTNEIGISSGGSGDVLLEARGAGSSIVTTTAILGGTGHVTLQAANNISLGDDVLTTGAGTLLIDALAGSVSIADGVDADLHGLETQSGQILVRAAMDVTINATVASTANGNIGIVAGNDVLQNANISTTGDVLVRAVNDITMASVAVTGNSNAILMDAGNTITLGALNANQVSLDAGLDILRAIGSATNVTAVSLRMVADSDANGSGSIGTSDLPSPPNINNNAIVTSVDVLAAQSATGIYVLEADDISIDGVAALTVSIDVTRVNFNSSTDPEPTVTTTLAGLSDLTTTLDGPIKLVAGSIIANDGTDGDGLSISADGTGDVLLRSSNDVVINATVQSDTGNISLIAGDDIDVNASVITSGLGDIYLNASNSVLADAVAPEVDGINVDALISTSGGTGTILLDSAFAIRTTANIISGGDIGLVADEDIIQNANIIASGSVLIDAGGAMVMAPGVSTTAGSGLIARSAVGDMTLGLITASNVSLEATGSILDGNGASLNVVASTLRMVAGGFIGGVDLASLDTTVNVNAIDTTVGTLAAQAGSGIYILETDGLIIDNVAAASIDLSTTTLVNFNSSTSSVGGSVGLTLTALDDLTTSAGPIKVAANGSITVNDGLDGDEVGVIAGGSGDILIDARGAGSNLTTTTAIQSGTGHISLLAGGDATLGDDVRTAGTGTILIDGRTVTVSDGGDADNDGIVSGAGDILVRSSLDININTTVTSGSGNIGLLAGQSVLQSADITTGGGDVFIQAGDDLIMSSTPLPTTITTSTSGGNILVQTGRDIRLAALEASTGHVVLDANRNILDENTDSRVNVTASSLSMSALTGAIGGPDAANGSPTTNDNAINTSVDILGAQSNLGIYIEEVNGLIVDTTTAFTVEIDTTQVNFNSSTTDFTTSFIQGSSSNLTTTGVGHIKVITLAGDITLNDGLVADGVSVSGTGSSDILISATGNLTANADILSGTGNITLSGNLVDLNANVTTGGAVLVLGTSVAIDGVITAGSDLLIVASGATADIVVNADLISGGNLGLDAGRNVLQNANMTTLGGDVLVLAGTDIRMLATSPGTVTTASGGGNVLLAAANGNIELAEVDAGAGRVSIEALNGSIVDANADARLNVTANTLRMIAGDRIGGATGSAAIDVDVVTLAARSANGIFVRDIAGGVTIDRVLGFTVTVTAPQVNFNSTTDAQSRSATHLNLEDLETQTGDIRVLAEGGTLRVNEGSDVDALGVTAITSGNILLETTGAASDVIINVDANIQTASGHITILAGDDISLAANIISNASGTIYLLASNGAGSGGVTMSAGTLLQTNNNNIRVVADGEGNVTLGLVDAGTASVSILAEGSILSNGAPTNVQADAVRLWADASVNLDGTQAAAAGNGVGNIGALATPIQTAVTTLAANSAGGIFVTDTDATIVAATGDIAVSQVNLDAVPTIRTDASLSDLTTTVNGPIQLLSGGTATLQDGDDADGIAITANGSGSVTVTAVTDVLVQADVLSGSGNIIVTAGTNIGMGAGIATGGDVTLTATTGAILETSAESSVSGNDLVVNSALFAHLHDTAVDTLTATVGSNGALAGAWQVLNGLANSTGDDFLGVLDDILIDPGAIAAIAAQIAPGSALAQQFQFIQQFGINYALYLKNTGNLVVNDVTAGSSATPNVYIETVGGTSNLIVNGDITTTSSVMDEGGVVLIAGNDLTISGRLVSESTLAMTPDQIIEIIGPSLPAAGEPFNDHVLANFFEGGTGPSAALTTSEFVLRDRPESVEDFRTHILQRVVIQFGLDGTPRESGFISLVGYADGLVEQFDVDEAFPASVPSSAALFTRSTPFSDAFLDANLFLPTTAIMRRSNDFFLFEDGGSTDLAVEAAEINNVQSLIVNSGLAIPTDPVAAPSLGYVSQPVFVTIEPIAQQIPQQIELEAPVTKDVIVAIYEIRYEDENLNGQVDGAELPSYEEVLKTGIDKDSEETRKVIKPKAGSTPTREDIDREKQAMQDDPTQPSGAYAIVKEDADGNKTVLEVFGIRDWPEENEEEKKEEAEVKVPKLQPFDPAATEDPAKNPSGSTTDAELVPPPIEVPGPAITDTSSVIPGSRDTQPTRFASAGLLLGSLTMMRHRAGQSARTTDTVKNGSQPRDFSRRARRRRQLEN